MRFKASYLAFPIRPLIRTSVPDLRIKLYDLRWPSLACNWAIWVPSGIVESLPANNENSLSSKFSSLPSKFAPSIQ